jgi:gas vesicle protein
MAIGNIPNQVPTFLSQSLGPSNAAAQLAAANQMLSAFSQNAPVAPPVAGPMMSGPAAIQALGGINAATPTAATAARTGILGRLGGPGRAAANAAGTATKVGRGGALARFGVPAAAGYFAGQGANALLGERDDNVDEGVTGALTGAGVGAGIGAAVGTPFFGIGAVPGALIGGGLGALAGGAIGLFGPKNSGEEAVKSELETQEKKLREVLSQFGVSKDLRDEALMQLRLGSMDASSKDQVKAVATTITQQLGQAVAADKAEQEQMRMRESNLAAVQAWMGPMLQQQLERQNFYAQAQAQDMRAAANLYADPSQAATARAMASQVPLDSASAAAAQLAQLAATPALFGQYTGVNGNGQANQDLLSMFSSTPTNQVSALEQMLGITPGVRG